MREHLHLYVPAMAGVVVSMALWGVLAKALARRQASLWRAAPLCLPLLLGSALYGLFWWGFFSSPAMAVQLHAIRLTIQHAVDGFAPWLIAAWILTSLALLFPLRRKT